MDRKEAMKIYRKLNPSARRTKSTAIVHCGGSQTIYGCVCGDTHTCATNYRAAKHRQEWEAEHADCVIRWVEKCMAATANKV